MTGILVSRFWLDSHGNRLKDAADEVGIELDYVITPDTPEERLTPEDCERIEIAFFSNELQYVLARPFFAAAQGAPNLTWLQLGNAGIDNPVFSRLLAKGVRISTGSGTSAKPIAESAITGMLMLARGFTRWAAQQREHAWKQLPSSERPPDLDTQTLVVFGLGPIGMEIARLAKAFGMHVVGVRRTPGKPQAPLDELRHPGELPAILPRADWLAVAAPLTDETRGLFGAENLARLPRGARVMNIARGELFDEAALIESLRTGHLAGAYLDVFEVEPLPADSPLWDLPDVIISPHNAGISAGNDLRKADLFIENFKRWARGEPLRNEVTAGA